MSVNEMFADKLHEQVDQLLFGGSTAEEMGFSKY